MSPVHRRFLVLEQGVGSAVVNFAINAVIAWGMFHGAASVPLWGQQSIAGDTIGTCFFLPFLTGLIVTKLARKQVQSGRVPPLGWRRDSHPLLGWLPSGTVRRAATLGVVCAVAVAPLAIWILSALQVSDMSVGRFVTFKATFAAALAAVVTPLIALWAIAER